MSKFSKIMSKFSKFLLAPVTCSNFAPRHSNRFGPPAECSKSDFGHFWAILALFGRSWAKIWGTPPPLQTGSKTSTWTSCNRFGPPENSRVLQPVRRSQQALLAPKRGQFLAIRARKRPAEQPNRHLPETQRYPELPQDLGNI